MKTQFVSALKAKDNVDSLFLIKVMNQQEGRDGRGYVNIILSDRTGDLEARIWTVDPHLLAQLRVGDVAKVQGKINVYQGRRQLVVAGIVPLAPGQAICKEDYYAQSAREPQSMLVQLEELVADLDDFYIRSLLQLILADSDIRERMMQWPAGKTIHHPYRGGLLEHTLSCCRLAVLLATHYQVNVNYVVAGALLHDIGKLYELSCKMTVDYTDEGKLLGHIVLGVELVERFAQQITNFPAPIKLHLKHMIVAHHGEMPHGSPQVPLSKESYVVFMMDLLDSKLSSMDEVIKNDQNPSAWSNHIKHLDRLVYKRALPHSRDFLGV